MKQFLTPIRIERWAVVNFSGRCDTSHLSRELINCGRNKGIVGHPIFCCSHGYYCFVIYLHQKINWFYYVQHIDRPHTLIEEDPQHRRSSPVVRVDRMFENILAKLPGPPQFLLCVLPERKNSEIYGKADSNVFCCFLWFCGNLMYKKLNFLYVIKDHGRRRVWVSLA